MLRRRRLVKLEGLAMGMKTVIGALGILSLSLPLGAAAAPNGAQDKVDTAKSAKRSPIKASHRRGTTFDLERYHSQMEVVRLRTAGKDYATFMAEPRLLDAGSVMIFEIRSVAKTGSVRRWKCVAENDIAECLGKPIKIRYLPADEKVVLVAKLKPMKAVGPKTAVARK
jgi:hypothetical protein